MAYLVKNTKVYASCIPVNPDPEPEPELAERYTYEEGSNDLMLMRDAINRVNYIKNVKCAGHDTMVFGFLTDLHTVLTNEEIMADEDAPESVKQAWPASDSGCNYYGDTAKYDIKLLGSICYWLGEYGIDVDAVFCGGDFSGGKLPYECYSYMLDKMSDLVDYYIQVPHFTVEGNHDRWYAAKDCKGNALPKRSNEEWLAYLKKFNTPGMAVYTTKSAETDKSTGEYKWGLYEGNCGNTYYVDFPKHKVRVIMYSQYERVCLSSFDGSAAGNGGGPFYANMYEALQMPISYRKNGKLPWTVFAVGHNYQNNRVPVWLSWYRGGTISRNATSDNYSFGDMNGECPGKATAGIIQGHWHRFGESISTTDGTINVLEMNTYQGFTGVRPRVLSIFVLDTTAYKLYDIKVGAQYGSDSLSKDYTGYTSLINVDYNNQVPGYGYMEYNISKSTKFEPDTPVEQTFEIQTQFGILNTETGLPKGAITAKATTKKQGFLQNCMSILMVYVKDCTISGIDGITGYTTNIFCYDENYIFTGCVDSVSAIPSDTAYIRFGLQSSTAITELPTITLTVTGDSYLSKNDIPQKVQRTYISYEVKEIQNVFDRGFDNTNAFNWDNCYVILPPNYTPDGEPVPLIVYAHGTTGYMFTQTGEIGEHKSLQEFLAKNGYAVCNCSGITFKHTGLTNAFGLLSYPDSVKSMVDYMCTNYNIKNEVYLYSKSAGGFLSHLPQLSQVLNIKAVASLSPALSTMISARAHAAANMYQVVNAEVNQFVEGAVITSDFINDETQKNYILDNIGKFRQLDPFFCSINLSDDQVRTIIAQLYDKNIYNQKKNNISNYTSYISSDPNGVIKASTGDSVIDGYIDNATRSLPCPTCIWIAYDDAAVFYGNADIFVQQANRDPNTKCFIRPIPRGYGGHRAVDSGTDTIDPLNTTVELNGETITIPIAFAEMVNWFKNPNEKPVQLTPIN